MLDEPTNASDVKVLLVDAAFSAMPIYEYLVASGVGVWVMGNRPEDVLACKAGHRWIKQDYSKVDEVAAIIDQEGFDYLVPGCTDVSLETCVSLRGGDAYFDSYETNEQLANKSAFRSLCANLGVPAPGVCRLQDFPREGTYICKPVDSYSGLGITIFDGADMDEVGAAQRAAASASPTGQIVFEQFLEGQLYSYSAFIEAREVTDSFLVIEGSSVNPFAVDTSYLVDSLPQTTIQSLRNSIELISASLQLKDGLVHTQFILVDGVPYLVEMSRRCPGDLYSLLIEYSSGYRYAAKYAGYFIGERVPTQRTTQSYVLRHTVTSERDAIYDGFRFEASSNLKAFYPLLAVGQQVLARQKSRIGVMFAESSDAVKLEHEYRRFVERGVYRVE